MALKLSPLPDRTPVRLTLSISPELAAALSDYARIYASTYGRSEKPETLAPHMLEAFLASDSGFKRARRTLQSQQSEPA